MPFRVRSARLEDVASIVSWTRDTFRWGDYVPERLPGWLHDDESEVLVCVDGTDRVLAMTHALMLSPTEGWLEAARVHPDHRRSGLGKTLNDAGIAWVRERGARVVRLAVEADNEPANRQVESLGYRRTSSWLFARWESHEVKPSATRAVLSQASAQDVDAAWVFWSTSDLAKAARGLLPENWRWRKARAGDLTRAATAGTLFQSPAGWALVTEVETDPDYLGADWAVTTPADCPVLVAGIIDLAAREKRGLYIRLPSLPWVQECLRRAGADPSEVYVFTMPVVR